jgi:hypothetical protein
MRKKIFIILYLFMVVYNASAREEAYMTFGGSFNVPAVYEGFYHAIKTLGAVRRGKRS